MGGFLFRGIVLSYKPQKLSADIYETRGKQMAANECLTQSTTTNSYN